MQSDSLEARFCRGDGKAFESIYLRDYAQAARTAYLICGDRHAAEDLAQEAFLLCHQRIEGLRDPAAYQAWFYRILVRLAWRRDKARPAAHWLQVEPPESRLPGPDAQLEREEAADAVVRAIAGLSPAHRTVIVLFYYRELTIPQIAQVVARPEGTVKSRLHHAKRQLAQALSQQAIEPTEVIPCPSAL